MILLSVSQVLGLQTYASTPGLFSAEALPRASRMLDYAISSLGTELTSLQGPPAYIFFKIWYKERKASPSPPPTLALQFQSAESPSLLKGQTLSPRKSPAEHRSGSTELEAARSFHKVVIYSRTDVQALPSACFE